jgi:hypothetical protein
VRYSALQTVLFDKNVRGAERNPTSVYMSSQWLGWYRNGSSYPLVEFQCMSPKRVKELDLLLGFLVVRKGVGEEMVDPAR